MPPIDNLSQKSFDYTKPIQTKESNAKDIVQENPISSPTSEFFGKQKELPKAEFNPEEWKALDNLNMNKPPIDFFDIKKSPLLASAAMVDIGFT